MNPLRRSAIARLVVPLAVCLLPIFLARAQTEIGPQAVWRPNQAAQSDLFNCPMVDGCTLSSVMAAHGATPEAVAFAQAREDWSFLAGHTDTGRVDVGELWSPFAADGNRAYELLNGNPPVVDAQSARDVDARAHPAYAPLYAAYPNLFLWGSDSVFDSMEPRPDGGQRFLFSYPLIDGCHACDLIDMARVAYDFDAAGNYLGLTYLDPASVAAAVPPIVDSNRAQRQIAYTISTGERERAGRGNIWLVNEDGRNPTQLTNSGLDCCATWSPDGSRLYYVRNSASGADPGPSAIIERDMATGAERAIGPSTNIAGALAVSADSTLLAYVSNSRMPATGPVIVDNIACLNLLKLETNESTQIDCLEQGFIGDLEFLPREPSLLVVQGGFEWSQVVLYDLVPSDPVPFSGVCCFSIEVSARDNRAYAAGNDYYMRSEFQANGWDGFGIFEYSQGNPEPVPLLLAGEPLGGLDLSPEEDRLVFVRDNSIEILDLATRQTTTVVSGLQPEWRPDAAAAAPAPPIDDLLDRKEATFDQLETTTFRIVEPLLPPLPRKAFDETAARELVAELRAADPATITPQQAAALERLVMQEETLAKLLEQYTRLADDEGDVLADVAVMSGGTGLLLYKAGTRPEWALVDLARKALEDFIKVWLNVIEDPAHREAAHYIVDAISLAIDAKGKDYPALAEDFFEQALGDGFRIWAAGQLTPLIVTAGQPAIDQSVRSVRGDESAWAVQGRTDSAAIQLDGLISQSTSVTNLAHNIYVDDLSKGRDYNELIKDIGDLLSVGSRGNFYALLVSLQARLQQALIDKAASSVLNEAMICVSDAAALSGDYAFRPSQPVYQCEVPVPIDLRDFFSRLFTERAGRFGVLSPASQSTPPEFDAALADYRTALNGLRAGVIAADNDAVAAAADELATAAAGLNAPFGAVMARLDPAAEGADTAGQMALGVALTTVRLDALLALLAADAYLADSASADMAAFGELLGTAAANAALPPRVLAVAPLPAAPAAAQPVVDAPTLLTANPGQTVIIPATVLNIGSTALEDGQLMLELDGQALAELPIPSLPPGESVVVSPEFTPDAPGRLRLRIVANGGDRLDYRTVDLIVDAIADSATAAALAPETAAPETSASETASTGLNANETTDSAAAEQPSSVGDDWLRPALLAVMAMSGVLLLVALVVYLWQHRSS